MPRIGGIKLPYSGRESPGDGITPALMSREPLATEGEATPGPDDYNPFDEFESAQQQARFERQRDAPPAAMPNPDPDLSFLF